MNSLYWGSDWFAALLITFVVVLVSGSAPFQSLETSFYNWCVRPTDRSPSNKITVVVIDKESVATILDFYLQSSINIRLNHDNKPANIMFEPDSDTVKIANLGIARITDSSKTKTGMVFGTPSYMSLEQLADNKVNGRSDLFSLGVMLYQMLSDSLPFKLDSMASLKFKTSNEEAADVRSVRDDIPGALAIVINKALILPTPRKFS